LPATSVVLATLFCGVVWLLTLGISVLACAERLVPALTAGPLWFRPKWAKPLLRAWPLRGSLAPALLRGPRCKGPPGRNADSAPASSPPAQRLHSACANVAFGGVCAIMEKQDQSF
jgi:hypothetical protein